MKTIKETTLLIDGESCLAWINTSDVMYAVEYQGIIYVTMRDGEKLNFDPQAWKTFWLDNR